jgi:hypothetical protein
MIKSVYYEYFQKSRVFLYPALRIAKGGSVTPIGTYTSWTGHYTHEDKRLMCVYHLRDDKEFKAFEKAKLLGNPLFEDFYLLEDDTGMYIFDFTEFAEDWNLYLEGKYSKIGKRLKLLILDHFSKSKSNYVYVDSYLNPELYYHIYSRVLECDQKILEDVGELCDKPDFDKETTAVELKSLEVSGFNLI